MLALLLHFIFDILCMTLQLNLVLELYCHIREQNAYFYYPHHRFRILSPCQE